MSLRLRACFSVFAVCAVTLILHAFSVTCMFLLSPLAVHSLFFFFSSRRRHTRCSRDWSSDVCSSDLRPLAPPPPVRIAPKPRNPFRAMQPVPRPTSPGLAAVVLQRGDSLWKLAERNLGQGARWRELLSLNPSIVDPDRVTAGSRIYVPLQAPAPRRPLRIRIQKGDTLWQIAQTQYGRGTAW